MKPAFMTRAISTAALRKLRVVVRKKRSKSPGARFLTNKGRMRLWPRRPIKCRMAPSTMSTVTSAALATSLEIPAHLRENFEKAEARLRKSYGESPPVHDLMRLWLACASSWDIERQFEEGLLEI